MTHSKNEALVRRFIVRWGVSVDEKFQAYRDVFAPECLWQNPGLPDLVGPDAAISLLEAGRKNGIETIKVDIEAIASTRDIVFTQRVDHVVLADGSVAASVSVAGVMRIKDDKIVRWQDYFDPTELHGLLD